MSFGIASLKWYIFSLIFNGVAFYNFFFHCVILSHGTVSPHLKNVFFSALCSWQAQNLKGDGGYLLNTTHSDCCRNKVSSWTLWLEKIVWKLFWLCASPILFYFLFPSKHGIYLTYLELLWGWKTGSATIFFLSPSLSCTSLATMIRFSLSVTGFFWISWKTLP